MSTIGATMQSTTVPVLDDETIEDEVERASKAHPGYVFDTSIALDGSSGHSEAKYVVDLDPDGSDLLAPDIPPEVEAMRAACASGVLISVQSVFQKYWLNRPINERIDKDMLGAAGLCEAIRRDDAVVASYLLSHMLSIHEGHFAMATEHRSYSILQLFVDLGWDINTSLGRCQPSALS